MRDECTNCNVLHFLLIFVGIGWVDSVFCIFILLSLSREHYIHTHVFGICIVVGVKGVSEVREAV
jgi:hypothetical protein